MKKERINEIKFSISLELIDKERDCLFNKIVSNVTKKLDHKNLNTDVDFMSGKLCSCENLCIEIWKILDLHLPVISKFAKLHSLRLYETPRNYVEYYGE